MKYFLLLLTTVHIPLFFQAASPSPLTTKNEAGAAYFDWRSPYIIPPSQKPGFFKRIALLYKAQKSLRHMRSLPQEISPADKKAKDSLITGIIALVCAMIPWYTLFLAIPLGIIAINLGVQAKRKGSEKMNGKGFGIAALSLVGLWMLLTALFIAAFTIGWGGIFAGG